MIDLDSVFDPIPSPARPTALTVTLRRHRADRFTLQAVTVRYFPGGMIGGWSFAATATQNPAYFAALDAWLPEQDHRTPYRDRLRRFQRLYESGWFDGEGG